MPKTDLWNFLTVVHVGRRNSGVMDQSGLAVGANVQFHTEVLVLAHATPCGDFFVTKAEFKTHDPSALKSRYRILALNHLNLFSFSNLR